MIRIAAVGDLHFGLDARGRYRPHLEDIADRADLFLLTGDLTKCGSPEEAKVVADEIGELPIPTITVLGNHDHHADAEQTVTKILEDRGVIVVEGSGVVVDVGGTRVGIAGTKGFGGGFAGACASAFGEREIKRFVEHARELACGMGEALASLHADKKIALMHYAPIPETLVGERLEIYPFLGSYFLAEAVDASGADLILHGHAHLGTEKGETPGGIAVRNVAQPVIGHAYNLYTVAPDPVPAGATTR